MTESWQEIQAVSNTTTDVAWSSSGPEQPARDRTSLWEICWAAKPQLNNSRSGVQPHIQAPQRNVINEVDNSLLSKYRVQKT